VDARSQEGTDEVGQPVQREYQSASEAKDFSVELWIPAYLSTLYNSLNNSFW
jgi:hypothetical protein